MESKPSRIPRRISVQPSSSSSSARTMDGSRGSSLTDTYHTRDSSLRLDAGCQESNLFHNSSRDWGIGERGETHEVPWKLNSSSPTRYSGTIDHPWSGRFLGSRSRLSASSSSSPFSSTWYGESENTQGAYSRLHNQQRDSDSKRPKLSYTSTSSVRSNGLNTVSDLNRPASSYAQGARPKDNSLSTLRLNTSMNHQLPSEHETSLFSRVSSRSSSRSNYSAREMEPSQRNIQPEFTHIAIRDEMPSPSNTERVLSQRSLSEPPADTEGRRTTRQLLSRLASSMSSTFFSRRSSQDSLNTRSDSEDSCVVPRVQTATQSSTNATARHEVPGIQTPEASQGFSFLRRRWGLSGVSQNHSSDSDVESYRQESESRNTGSWLSSSLRNRCTPLFSRRRREGRDESARTSTSDTPGRSLHLFRRRESSEETQLEAQSSSSGAAASTPVPAVSSSPTTTASTPDSAHSIRNSGVSGILPGSLFRLAVPPSLGSSLSDNVMITVDIIPSSWNQPDAEEIDKSKILPSRDPERLQKIKESLLLEDTEEEEGDLCRICQMSSTSPTNLLIEPCKCTGSLQYVHQECMKKWLQSKINSGSSLEAVTTCELCKEKLHLNLEDFDIHELYRAHANEQADYEFISSGLYLVVLLHLCEQRFSDMLGTASEASTRVRFINLARTLQAHMEDIETSEDDSEDSDAGRSFDTA
ncbi:E3 ubiquitin-protein ligase MARCHF7 isoform X7 [Pelodiscus sinensis]|uniref:E3 ubiquitin-protein ligase MARCHF7 isoform X7 n=1 Tax=Pelodiscus sinensis TaxID=13735 RepID=UPI003F6B0581